VITDNRSMPSRRTARIVARFLLAWFALYLGAATAAPLIAPGGYAVICSADGIARLVQTDDAGVPGESRASLHCPLCVPASAPPPPSAVSVETPAHWLAQVLTPSPTTPWLAPLAAAPPPARGPPAST
jgi:hypothetical protein